MTESEIIKRVEDLNTDKNPNIWDGRTLGKAPHKPFLLLSIMDGIEVGRIQNSQIGLDQNLIETFFRYWNGIMGESRKTTIALPFFHMKSEPFWELVYNEGMKPYQNSPSLGGLTKRLAHAKIDDGFFKIIQKDNGRKKIISVILRTYFSQNIRNSILEVHEVNIGAYHYARQLELLAAEPFEKDHSDGSNEVNYTTKSILKRRYGFAIQVRDNYKHRCAVCRAKVKTPNGESLVEGAHIIPFSVSMNDDPRNGLALCKTHHWMFDSYLLTIQPNYRIKLSEWLKDKGEKIEGTLNWNKKEILLPEEEQFLPSGEALEEHCERFEFMKQI